MSWELLSAGLDRINFSMDENNREGFEYIRRGLNFNRVLHNALTFKKLRNEHGFKCRINVNAVLCKENEDRQRDIVNFLNAISDVPVKMGRARKRADIVVFYENKEHTQENIYMILEVKTENIKPSDRKEGVDQLASYMAASPNSSFALWVGNERLAFKVVEEKGRKALAEIPDTLLIVPIFFNKASGYILPNFFFGRIVP